MRASSIGAVLAGLVVGFAAFALLSWSNDEPAPATLRARPQELVFDGASVEVLCDGHGYRVYVLSGRMIVRHDRSCEGWTP